MPMPSRPYRGGSKGGEAWAARGEVTAVSVRKGTLQQKRGAGGEEEEEEELPWRRVLWS